MFFTGRCFRMHSWSRQACGSRKKNCWWPPIIQKCAVSSLTLLLSLLHCRKRTKKQTAPHQPSRPPKQASTGKPSSLCAVMEPHTCTCANNTLCHHRTLPAQTKALLFWILNNATILFSLWQTRHYLDYTHSGTPHTNSYSTIKLQSLLVTYSES